MDVEFDSVYTGTVSMAGSIAVFDEWCKVEIKFIKKGETSFWLLVLYKSEERNMAHDPDFPYVYFTQGEHLREVNATAGRIATANFLRVNNMSVTVIDRVSIVIENLDRLIG